MQKTLPNITANASKSPSLPFSITAEKRGSRAEIRIIGIIGWETTAEDFRKTVDQLVKDGVKDAHIYINTPGGSCVDASEIVNIIGSFKGNITGEGGALVASAGTFIALHCKEFSMPANGQFMVHKPSGAISGNVKDIENYAKGLKDVENLYYDAFKAVATDLTAFEDKWNAGDWWMTADEALKMGFITSVKPHVKIDKETANMATACGCPVAMAIDVPEDNNNPQKQTRMDFIALALGLKTGATEAEITAEVTALKAKAKRVDELEATIKNLQLKQVTTMVDAQVGRKITTDKRQHFIDLGVASGIDSLQATFDAMAEFVKPTNVIVVPKSVDGKTDKTFKDLTDTERVQLRETNRVEYTRLFKAEYGFDPKFQ